MRDLLEQLHLDPERIAYSRDTSAGFGRAYMEDSREDANRVMRLFAAASSFRRAGADALLLDDIGVSRTFFAASAQCYLRAGSPYGHLISLLAFDEAPYALHSEKADHQPDDVFTIWHDHFSRPKSQIGDNWESAGHSLEDLVTRPVGLFGLPVEAYLRVIKALSYTAPEHALAQALLPFISLYSVALSRSMKDRFHWSRLLARFHPMEPDILAILVPILTSERKREQLSVALSSVSLDPISATVLRGALTLYRPFLDLWRR